MIQQAYILSVGLSLRFSVLRPADGVDHMPEMAWSTSGMCEPDLDHGESTRAPACKSLIRR